VNDRLERLEAELARLRPRPLPEALHEQIEARLATARRPWADRFLVSTMCAGALAACVIFAILLGPLRASIEPPLPAPMSVQQRQDDANVPRFAEHWFASGERETS
jgi:hypothetical protein